MNRERFPHLFADVPPAALFEHGGELFTRYGRTLRAHTVATHRKRRTFKPLDVVRMSPGEARNAPRARVLTVSGESAPYREVWTRQRAPAGCIVCRFVVFYRGHWRRLFSDCSPGLAVPHFVNVAGSRVPVTDVAP
ncbi:hypothetical protein [Xanthomonas phage AhaSv]|nr:hypothetical protein [Xanthomonas phage AhaSv]